MADLIDQALHEDAELNSESAARSPGRGSEQANAKKPSNLGEHLLAAVGKAEEISSGNADDGGDHGDESRGDETRSDKADSGIAGTSNGGPTSPLMSRSRHLFTGHTSALPSRGAAHGRTTHSNNCKGSVNASGV